MNNTVLITGSSSGIGKATASHFAKMGWNVVKTMRSVSEGTRVAGPKNTLVTRLNVQDTTSIQESIAAGIARFGRIDVLINNAGYGQYGLFEAIPEERVLKQFAVNVFGVMAVTRAILPHFRQNKSGTIINVSSGAGVFTVPMSSLYCASKFALEGFSEALSYELASQGIAVKIVEPHGRVASTRFNERSTREYAKDASLADYDLFVKSTNETFAKVASTVTMNAKDVAKVIFKAATDHSSKLRYLVGDDYRGRIKARSELCDQDYVDFMRAHFQPEA